MEKTVKNILSLYKQLNDYIIRIFNNSRCVAEAVDYDMDSLYFDIYEKDGQIEVRLVRCTEEEAKEHNFVNVLKIKKRIEPYEGVFYGDTFALAGIIDDWFEKPHKIVESTKNKVIIDETQEKPSHPKYHLYIAEEGHFY